MHGLSNYVQKALSQVDYYIAVVKIKGAASVMYQITHSEPLLKCPQCDIKYITPPASC